MSEDFKEFLKNKVMSSDMEGVMVYCVFLEGSFKTNHISIEDLGEWAWKELLKLLSVSENVRKGRIHEYNLLKNIADSCLGKEEIEKRKNEL